MDAAQPSHSRSRIVIDVPDVISCADLADRLEPHSPHIAPTGDDGCRLTVREPRGNAELRTLLATVQEWAQYWQIRHTPVRVGRRSYTLHARRLAWRDL